MSFLRAIGLKDGIEVLFKRPCSEAYLKSYKTELGKQIIKFYRVVVEPSLFKKKEIAYRHRDIYRYVKSQGFELGELEYSALKRMQADYKMLLEDYGLDTREIIKRVNGHYA